jgi:hypothetical protein
MHDSTDYHSTRLSGLGHKFGDVFMILSKNVEIHIFFIILCAEGARHISPGQRLVVIRNYNADRVLKVCHSEEVNAELFCLIYNNRPTKNLTFPKPKSVFCRSWSELVFIVDLKPEILRSPWFQFTFLGKYFLLNHQAAASRSLRMTDI